MRSSSATKVQRATIHSALSPINGGGRVFTRATVLDPATSGEITCCAFLSDNELVCFLISDLNTVFGTIMSVTAHGAVISHLPRL